MRECFCCYGSDNSMKANDSHMGFNKLLMTKNFVHRILTLAKVLQYGG